MAGCGDDDDAGPAALTPPDAPLFAEVEVAGAGAQAEALESFAARVSGVEDPQAAVIEEIDREFAADGDDITYADDVESWIGSRAGLFVRSFEATEVVDGVPDFAIAIEADDPEAAGDFLEDALARDPEPEEERTYADHSYWFARESGGLASGMIGSYLVVGSEPSFKVAVDASEGESLEQSETYTERVAELPEERAGTAFIEPGAAIDAALAANGVGHRDHRALRPLLAGPLGEPMAAGVTFADEHATLDVVAAYGETSEENPELAIARLPAGSWLAASAPDLGPSLGRLLQEIERGGLPGSASLARELRMRTGIEPRRDVLQWLGGAAGFIEGTGVPGFTAGVIAETAEVDGPRRLLTRLRGIASRDSGLGDSGPPEGADYGFSLGIPSLGGGVEGGVVGDRLAIVIGGTLADALEPGGELGSDDRFATAAEALGDEYRPNAFVHLPTLLEVAASGDPDDPDYPAARPYVERLESLLGGVRFADGQLVSRWTLTLAPQ